MPKLVNFTPHPLNVRMEDGQTVTVPPQTVPARLSESVETVVAGGIAFHRKVYGKIEGLPMPDPDPEVLFVVSAMVMLQAKRIDVVAPGNAIRDEEGKIVGCDGLSIHPDLSPPIF